MKTNTGAEILEVFWFDETRRTAGLLVRRKGSPPTTWASEYSLRDLRAADIEQIRSEAMVRITDGEVSYKAGA